jgi:transcription initiation factor TFIID subunit 7
MQSVVQLDTIDAVDGGLADDGDGESDNGQIDEDLAAEIMEDLDREWEVALNEEEGDGIEEEEEEEEEEEVEEEGEEEEHERMELEE